ncbi:MAG: sulfite exporter TauE/SafE family protein [Desulfobaccales bacterium]
MTVTLPTASYWLSSWSAELVRLGQPVAGWFYTISPQGELSVNLVALVALGVLMGLLVGSFGVGSGFLMAPFLNLVGNIPYNVAIGSDLTQMLGSATVANLRQRGLGYVDYKLALLLLGGSIIGVECGARLVEGLKYAGVVTAGGRTWSVLQLAMTAVYVLLLGWIGTALLREMGGRRRLAEGAEREEGPVAIEGSRLRTLNLPPRVSLPVSGIESISLWLILGVGWVSGLLTGFLGVSGAFVRMPALIYVLGVPTVVSLGTNLFEMFMLALYGTLTHSLKGNVDLILVFILLLATTAGSQIGALLQRKIVGPRILKAYTFLFFLTILLMVLKLGR